MDLELKNGRKLMIMSMMWKMRKRRKNGKKWKKKNSMVALKYPKI